MQERNFFKERNERLLEAKDNERKAGEAQVACQFGNAEVSLVNAEMQERRNTNQSAIKGGNEARH